MRNHFILVCLVTALFSLGCSQDEKVEADTKLEHDSPPEFEKIHLNAFIHFKCSDNWTNRDGGLGLVAGTNSGTCQANFPGRTGKYRVTLMAQLEFDGGPKFRVSLDGDTIVEGVYPLSKGELICNCPNWRTNCPDRVVPIDAGVHRISTGSTIEFYGAEVYPCGDSHGAYAKWRELVFSPAK